jgi:N-acetylmuramoyl-L-alanine amidase
MRKWIQIVVIGLIISFVANSASANSSFPDTSNSFAAEEIVYLSNQEIINGFPDGKFYPKKGVTRAEAAVMVVRSFNYDEKQRKTYFSDVPVGHYASGAIQTAYEKGIVGGYGDGTFHPNAQITRAELSYLFEKAFQLTKTSNVTYSDVPVHSMAYAPINKLTTANIATGYPDGSFGPNKTITREEFSAFLARALSEEFRLTPEPEPSTPQTSTKQAYVVVSAGDTLNVRKGPGTSYSVLGALSYGKEVTIFSEANGWAYIQSGTLKGYVSTYYLKSELPPASKLAGQTIVIDAGHGGHDPGAMNNGLVEKEVNLAVSLKVEKYLKAAGVNVVMTRKDNNTFLELADRAKMSQRVGASSFISIHSNNHSGASANGTETYYYAAASQVAVDSKKLASAIQKRLVLALGTYDRGIKNAGFYVIKYNSVPSALVELGFLSNKDDAAKLGSDAMREKAAQAIYYGIKDYYESK